jgi:hypothetical protein
MNYIIPQLSKPLDLHPDYPNFLQQVLSTKELGQWNAGAAAMSINKLTSSLSSAFKYPPSYILIAHPKTIMNLELDLSALRNYGVGTQHKPYLVKILNRPVYFIGDHTINPTEAYLCFNDTWISKKTNVYKTSTDTLSFEQEIDFSKPLKYSGHIKHFSIVNY